MDRHYSAAKCHHGIIKRIRQDLEDILARKEHYRPKEKWLFIKTVKWELNLKIPQPADEVEEQTEYFMNLSGCSRKRSCSSWNFFFEMMLEKTHEKLSTLNTVFYS